MIRVQLNVTLEPSTPWTEILIAEFSELGFDSFVELDNGLEAYINEDIYKEISTKLSSLLTSIPTDVKVDYHVVEIPFQNWNEIWESDFHPVYVEDKLTILAPFHVNEQVLGLPIYIQPQMSFGTGHHQTTWLMSKAMFGLNPFPKNVLDMGTGTGVLAILAEKLGAQNILAVDIEPWSVENTSENATRNNCIHIAAKCGSGEIIENIAVDLVLANINKNILKEQFKLYADCLSLNGILMISGFFETDANELVEFAANFSLKKTHLFTKETWAAIQFVKN